MGTTVGLREPGRELAELRGSFSGPVQRQLAIGGPVVAFGGDGGLGRFGGLTVGPQSRRREARQ